jgi:hypothetical protein
LAELGPVRTVPHPLQQLAVVPCCHVHMELAGEVWWMEVQPHNDDSSNPHVITAVDVHVPPLGPVYPVLHSQSLLVSLPAYPRAHPHINKRTNKHTNAYNESHIRVRTLTRTH